MILYLDKIILTKQKGKVTSKITRTKKELPNIRLKNCNKFLEKEFPGWKLQAYQARPCYKK
jgi:transcriptional regulator of heat shock response